MMDQTQNSKIKNQNLAKSSKPELKYRAFYLSLSIINFVGNLPQNSVNRIICDQLVRCVTSIGANIVEAKSSSSKREFINYFQISLKSTNETKYWLALLREILPDKKDDINKFIQEAEEIGKIIGSSVLTMKGKKL